METENNFIDFNQASKILTDLKCKAIVNAAKDASQAIRLIDQLQELQNSLITHCIFLSNVVHSDGYIKDFQK